MRTLIISYDLHKQGQDYSSLFDEIKSCSINDIWCRPLKSVWIIRTNLTAKDCRKRLQSRADSNDEFLVIEYGVKDYSFYLDKEIHDIIENSLLV